MKCVNALHMNAALIFFLARKEVIMQRYFFAWCLQLHHHKNKRRHLCFLGVGRRKKIKRRTPKIFVQLVFVSNRPQIDKTNKQCNILRSKKQVQVKANTYCIVNVMRHMLCGSYLTWAVTSSPRSVCVYIPPQESQTRNAPTGSTKKKKNMRAMLACLCTVIQIRSEIERTLPWPTLHPIGRVRFL